MIKLETESCKMYGSVTHCEQSHIVDNARFYQYNKSCCIRFSSIRFCVKKGWHGIKIELNRRKMTYFSSIILRKKDLAWFSLKFGLKKIFIYSYISDIWIKTKLPIKRKIISALLWLICSFSSFKIREFYCKIRTLWMSHGVNSKCHTEWTAFCRNLL